MMPVSPSTNMAEQHTAKNEKKLVQFLCTHFDASEMMYLARGVTADVPQCITSLPPISTTPLEEWVWAFIASLQRHDILDEEFFRALAASRPRSANEIQAISEHLCRGSATTTTTRTETKDLTSRVRVRLEVELDSLSNKTLDSLLDVIRRHAGDARITIESLTRGSVNMVLRGNSAAIERLRAALSSSTAIAGIPILAVERVHGGGQVTGAGGEDRRWHGTAHPRLILDSFNLNDAERLLCIEALKTAGSLVEAAQMLGITRHALKRRIIKHNIRWSQRPVVDGPTFVSREAS